MSVARSSAEYLAHLREGMALTVNDASLPELKVAVLADHTSEPLCHVLASLLKRQGFFARLYRGAFNASAIEVYDPASPLKDFNADYVLLSICVQQYRTRFLAATGAALEELPRNRAREVLSLAAQLTERGCTVIVNTLALPRERQFGNWGISTTHSLYGSVLEFNRILVEGIKGLPSACVNDVTYLCNMVGAEEFLDDRLWTLSKHLCRPKYHLPLAESVARIILATRGKIIKCVIFDPDNTLWGGNIGEDDLDGIELGGSPLGEAYQDFQRYLLSLKRRGILLAVSSKIEPDVVLRPFRVHPAMVLKEGDLACVVASPEDKASGVAHILRTLKLEANAVVFLDGAAFERPSARNMTPGVCVLQLPSEVTDFVPHLEASGHFEAMVATALAERKEPRIEAASLDDYLNSLQMVLECGPFGTGNLPRVAQLLQRSNQFNLRTQRYAQATCEQMAGRDDHITLAASMKDRFGDHGLIAVVCGKIDRDLGQLEILELVMSYRVLKRGVEEMLLNVLVERCRALGLGKIRGIFVATGRNETVRDLYQRLGFQLESSDVDGSSWSLELAGFSPLKSRVKATWRSRAT